MLTGGLDDGTLGLMAIKRDGGIAIVQDPADALFPGMPASAAENSNPDYVVPLDEIGPLLDRVSRTPVAHERGANFMSRRKRSEPDVAEVGTMHQVRHAAGSAVEVHLSRMRQRCGKCRMENSCDTAVTSDTGTPPTRFWPPRTRAWKMCCGARCGRGGIGRSGRRMAERARKATW